MLESGEIEKEEVLNKGNEDESNAGHNPNLNKLFIFMFTINYVISMLFQPASDLSLG